MVIWTETCGLVYLSENYPVADSFSRHIVNHRMTLVPGVGPEDFILVDSTWAKDSL